MATAAADPVVCSCKNNCIRKPGRAGERTRGICACYVNGTVCTDFCKCGRGHIECQNTIDAHLDAEEEVYGTLSDDPQDFLFEAPTANNEMSLAVYYQDHDEEVQINVAEDDLDVSLQAVAEEHVELTRSMMESDEEESAKAKPNEKRQTRRKAKTRSSRAEMDADRETLALKVTQLSSHGLQTLMLKMVRLYPELVEMAMDPDPEGPLPGTPLRWCHCDRCRPMPTTREQLCCRLEDGDCILIEQAGPINQLVLSRRALEVAVHNHNEYCVQNDDPNSNSTLRHMAYRKFILWRRGYLGAGNRVVIPSCVVWAIRDRYPSADGNYTGFIPSRDHIFQ